MAGSTVLGNDGAYFLLVRRHLLLMRYLDRVADRRAAGCYVSSLQVSACNNIS